MNLTMLCSNLQFDSNSDKIDYEKLKCKCIAFQQKEMKWEDDALLECVEQKQAHGIVLSQSYKTSSSTCEQCAQLQCMAHQNLINHNLFCEHDSFSSNETDIALQSFLNTPQKVDNHTWDSIDELAEGDDEKETDKLFVFSVLLIVTIILIKVFWITPHEAFRPYNETGPVATQPTMAFIPYNRNLPDSYKSNAVYSGKHPLWSEVCELGKTADMILVTAHSSYDKWMTFVESIPGISEISSEFTPWDTKVNLIQGNYSWELTILTLSYSLSDELTEAIKNNMQQLVSQIVSEPIVTSVGTPSGSNSQKHFNSLTGST